MLRKLGLQVVEHAFQDHATLDPEQLEFGDTLPVFMTEKDAVKLGNGVDEKLWYVPVEFHMEAVAASSIIEHIESRLCDRMRVA